MSVSIRGLSSLLHNIEEILAAPPTPGPRLCQFAGASDSFLQLFILSLLRRSVAKKILGQKIVIVLPNQKDLLVWANFLDSAVPALATSTASYGGLKAAVLPFYGSWGADRFINPSLSRKQRIYALSLLADLDANGVVLTTLHGLAQKTLPPKDFAASRVSIAVNDERDQDEFCARLREAGYHSTPSVEDEGTFSVRGGIVDVYPLNHDMPLRIEFLGDTIASMRTFSAVDQKSKHSLTKAHLAPAAEVLTPESERKGQAQKLFNFLIDQQIIPADRDGFMASFQSGFKPTGFDMLTPLLRTGVASGLNYLDTSDILVFPKSIDSCLESYAEYYKECEGADEKDRAAVRPSLQPHWHFVQPSELSRDLVPGTFTIESGNPFSQPNVPFLRYEGRSTVAGAPPPPSKEGAGDLFDKWCDTFQSHLIKEEASIAILANQPEQVERIRSLLSHRGLPVHVALDILDSITAAKPLVPGVTIGLGTLQSHLLLEDSDQLVVPESALFGAKTRKAKPASAKLQNFLSSFKDLKPGDLVVHVQHGIGRYTGMTSLEVAGITTDFLIIEYASNDKIYLPVDRLSLLQRYSSGGEGGGAALDRLGGPGWEKRKAKVKGAVKDMAADLLKIQAQRELAKHYRYSPPSDTYFQFEAAFPYEETEDQLKALADIQADFAEAKPMDRLICGDVGFGKTEVAIRATLRAVLEGFQVLVLVPTTVLCYQHYRTFTERLGKIGLRVAQVNRFVDAASTRRALEELENGKLDVLVGTHRILSGDIKPKKLGLIIIDEEQRFGVTHKEKLKQMRSGADILTLTATPIPRTLHMAMLGLRDISLIATPPIDRIAVKTYVSRFDETLIREAIEREVQRGGQVFFVHNRVQDIEEVRLFVKSLVPGVDVRVGHGQMREHQLEQVIIDFIEQKFPVLVCTTIIESGIDMPNVNTLIINHAERFGLAQLYQLRGRVGRSSQQAFAYFLTAAEERLTDESKRRLEVIAAHQELGAGFQIASHDLEIRGAGNLLGGEQSGHVSEIGLELYTEMLDEAIAEVRGQVRQEKVDTEIKIPISALIPNTYIESESHRLQFYKSLFSAENDDDLQTIKQEVIDRYGPPPPEFQRLLKVARLKRLLRAIGATTLSSSTKGFFELKFGSLSERQIDKIVGVVNKKPDKYRLSPDYKLFVYADVPARPDAAQQDGLLNDLISLFEPLAHEIESLN